MADPLADSGFLQALYDTALYAGDWRPALTLSAEILASAEISLSAVDGPAFVTWETTKRLLSEEALDRYARHYGALDPKMRLLSRGGGGFVFNDSAYFDDAFVSRDPFYQEFTRWVGTRYTLDMALGSEPGRSVFLAANRTAEQGPFQPSTELTFAGIAGHIGRVHSLRVRLDDAQAKARYAEAALDGLAYGLIVLDAEGRAVLVNGRARRLTLEGGALELRQNRLAARSPALDRDLQAMLEQARSGARLEASSIRLPGPADAALIIWVVRLPASSPLAARSAPGTLVIVGDSGARGRVRREDLIKIYALTPAEADLALALGGGLTLRDAAAERGVAYVTARSQLYALLEKTGVHRQADLTRLIAALPGAILGDPGG
jgi:DNA-binding CsgD family transcriptional regulator/PAS domain-containing protein